MSNRRKNTKDPTRIDNYNKFLTTLDNPPRKESKFDEIRRKMPDEDSTKREIDKILENIHKIFNLNNMSSSNFTGQTNNDIASSFIEPNDPNVYVNYLNKNLNIKIYKALTPKQYPSPNKKEEEPNVAIRETIDIDVEINNITDLLKLIDTYKDDPAIKYNINMKALHSIKEPLEELNNMIGKRFEE